MLATPVLHNGSRCRLGTLAACTLWGGRHLLGCGPAQRENGLLQVRSLGLVIMVALQERSAGLDGGCVGPSFSLPRLKLGFGTEVHGRVLRIRAMRRKDEVVIVLTLPTGLIDLFLLHKQEVNPTLDIFSLGSGSLICRRPLLERVEGTQAMSANQSLQLLPVLLLWWSRFPIHLVRLSGIPYILANKRQVSVKVSPKEQQLIIRTFEEQVIQPREEMCPPCQAGGRLGWLPSLLVEANDINMTFRPVQSGMYKSSSF